MGRPRGRAPPGSTTPARSAAACSVPARHLDHADLVALWVGGHRLASRLANHLDGPRSDAAPGHLGQGIVEIGDGQGHNGPTGLCRILDKVEPARRAHRPHHLTIVHDHVAVPADERRIPASGAPEVADGHAGEQDIEDHVALCQSRPSPAVLADLAASVGGCSDIANLIWIGSAI